jgi:hypothetical protein
MYPKPGIGHYEPVMNARRHMDLDELMRSLMVVGFVALMTWMAVGVLGVIAGYLEISPRATLRFLLAVLVLVFARRTYWRLREWQWKHQPADERLGFANPLVPPQHGDQFLSVREGDVEVQATTGSPQRQG